jgi:hypothetical protein
MTLVRRYRGPRRALTPLPQMALTPLPATHSVGTRPVEDRRGGVLEAVLTPTATQGVPGPSSRERGLSLNRSHRSPPKALTPTPLPVRWERGFCRARGVRGFELN